MHWYCADPAFWLLVSAKKPIDHTNTTGKIGEQQTLNLFYESCFSLDLVIGV